MAKLFYTIDEAAAKLGKTPAELMGMARAGQLEEFKMHDQVHFKQAVIDQLVVDDLGDLDLSGADFDLDAASGTARVAQKSGSVSPAADDLTFLDEPPSTPAAKVGDELELDLDDELVLGDLEIPTAPPAGAASSAQPAPSAAPDDEPLGIMDSADASGIGIAPVSKGSAAKPVSPANADDGLDLDLGLDLGDEAAAPAAAPAPQSTFDLLEDSRDRSGSGMANDASGSMAPPPTRKGAAAKGDFLDLDLDQAAVTGDASFAGESDSHFGSNDDSTDSDQSHVSAALLDDGSEDTFGTGTSIGGVTGLFAEPSDGEGFDADSATGPIGAGIGGGGLVPLQAERVDSAASGLGLGLMVGAFAAIILAALVVVGSRVGGGSSIATMITQDLLVWGGGLALATILAGGIGFFVGRAIE